MDSRAKGARGELEAAEALGRIGLDCRRSVQYCGRGGDADLVCDAELHIEVKLTERLNPYSFMSQAIRDSRSKKTPIVVMRSSYKPWLVLVRLDDVPALAEEIIRARGVRPKDQRADVRLEGAGAEEGRDALRVEVDEVPQVLPSAPSAVP